MELRWKELRVNFPRQQKYLSSGFVFVYLVLDALNHLHHSGFVERTAKRGRNERVKWQPNIELEEESSSLWASGKSLTTSGKVECLGRQEKCVEVEGTERDEIARRRRTEWTKCSPFFSSILSWGVLGRNANNPVVDHCSKNLNVMGIQAKERVWEGRARQRKRERKGYHSVLLMSGRQDQERDGHLEGLWERKLWCSHTVLSHLQTFDAQLVVSKTLGCAEVSELWTVHVDAVREEMKEKCQTTFVLYFPEGPHKTIRNFVDCCVSNWNGEIGSLMIKKIVMSLLSPKADSK